MKKNDVAQPRLVGRNQELPVAPSQSSTTITPSLIENVVSISNQTTAPEDAQIRAIAFSLYEQRGCRDGHDVEDWLEAEAILREPKRAA